VEWTKINRLILKKRMPLKSFLIYASPLIYLCIVLITSAWGLRGDSFESVVFFIIVLCICIFSDIGGYIVGKIIGGKKLTKISPNKTISGSVGSFMFSTFPLYLFNFQSYIETSFSFYFNGNYINHYFDLSLKNIFFCLIVSLACQLGDLLISYFKRLNKVSDSGTILPGHGGLLDRIDGIIFAIPTVYILKITEIF
jgi:phosphatidate cytidylyltransferase